MIIGDDFENIEFVVTEILPEHLPRAGDVSCFVKVRCNNFAGEVESVWFAPEDISLFLSDLRNLEATRKGSANLLNLSSQSESNPLHFEISPSDKLGNLLVKVQLQKFSYFGSSPLSNLQVTFGLGGEYLQKTLLDFEKMFRGK